MPKITKSTTLIKATGIRRSYGNTVAVKNLSFELKAGDILGFLGPNGAGKSTSMQILSGSLAPDAGEIEINGIDLIENPTAAKQQLGYLPEQPPLYKELTVDEYLSYAAQLRGISSADINSCLVKAKQRCGLNEAGKKLISNLSKGYQQRVGIAQAIIHSPAVIILDEPTVGLDPIQIQEIRQLIIELGQEHGIILSTHILPEVQAVCNRVQIIRDGELVYHSDMQSLESELQQTVYEVITREHIDSSMFSNISSVNQITKTSDSSLQLQLSAQPEESDKALQQITQLINEKQLTLLQLSAKKQSLEQVFIDLTTREKNTDSDEVSSV